MARNTSTTKSKDNPNREVNALKNKLRGEAEREVLARHRAEVNEVAEAKFKEAGIEFTRRLTEEERDEKKLRELLAKNPNLRKVVNEELPTPGSAEGAGPHVAGPDAADFQPEHDNDSDR